MSTSMQVIQVFCGRAVSDYIQYLLTSPQVGKRLPQLNSVLTYLPTYLPWVLRIKTMTK